MAVQPGIFTRQALIQYTYFVTFSKVNPGSYLQDLWAQGCVVHKSLGYRFRYIDAINKFMNFHDFSWSFPVSTCFNLKSFVWELAASKCVFSLFRWALLQLHHVPGDSALVQWCPQKLDSKEILLYKLWSLWVYEFMGLRVLLTSLSVAILRWGVLDQARSCPHLANRRLEMLLARSIYSGTDLRWFLLFWFYIYSWTCLLISQGTLWDGMQAFLAFAEVVHAEMCQCAKLLWHNRRNNTQVFPRQSRALLETMHACYTFLRLELITKQSKMQHM